MQICTKCGVEKTLSDFYKKSDSKRGVKSVCKKCVNQQMFIYSRNRYATVHGRASQMFNSAKYRAKKRNISFDLDFNYIKLLVEMGYCAQTGLKLDLNVNDETHYGFFAPSLDRVDAKKGYTNDNIQVVCNMYNMGKSDADELNFIAMCMAVAERNSNNQAAIDRLNELRNAKL
jgi:hypothetical protein